jgi:lipoate-protein ligase A
MIKPVLIESNSNNPWYNLALEEYLFNTINPDEVVLYLWQNNHTVVIGRNQNAWKECNCEKLENDGGKLARRLSGGGAVYHDLGNMNFTFIMHKNNYNMEKQLSVLINSLKHFNVNAEFSGRNDMLIDGKKFSGHAYYFKDNKAYHHGTLLVNSDLEKLSFYLNPSKKKIESKGVDSVRSRVTNIADIDKDISIYRLANALKKSFEESYGTISNYKIYDYNDSEILKLQDKYSSWDWIYGKSPKFDISFSDRFAWGEVEIALSLKNGIITDMQVYTDAMDTSLFEGFSSGFIGSKLNKELMAKLCEKQTQNMSEDIRKDVNNFIANTCY